MNLRWTAPILFGLILGILDVGFYFLQKNALISALDQVTRVIQTGEIHDIPKGEQEQFLRNMVCSSSIIPGCTQRIEAQTRVLNNGDMDSAMSGGQVDRGDLVFDAGAATQIVGVEIIYRLPTGIIGPILEQSRGPDGEVYINAMTVFRTEPY